MSHDITDTESTARTLVADGKGILAADETPGTLTKRFDALGIRSTEQSRRTYREMLFTAPDAATFISGVIMQDETIRQKSSTGTPLAQVLASRGIVPGIKVDTGAKPLAARTGRDHHRGARRAPGSSRGIPGHGRTLREMAGGDPHRRRAAEPRLRERERPCAGAICRALSGSGPRADRRAGSVDGRIALDRALRRGHHHGAARRVPGPLRAADLAGGHAAQAQHGRPGQGELASRLRAGGRDCDAALPAPDTCRRRCPASCSCRAVRAIDWPPPI